MKFGTALTLLGLGVGAVGFAASQQACSSDSTNTGGGPIVGFLCESLQRMARERDAAERAAAAAEIAKLKDDTERVRLVWERTSNEAAATKANRDRLVRELDALKARLG